MDRHTPCDRRRQRRLGDRATCGARRLRLFAGTAKRRRAPQYGARLLGVAQLPPPPNSAARPPSVFIVGEVGDLRFSIPLMVPRLVQALMIPGARTAPTPPVRAVTARAMLTPATAPDVPPTIAPKTLGSESSFDI